MIRKLWELFDWTSESARFRSMSTAFQREHESARVLETSVRILRGTLGQRDAEIEALERALRFKQRPVSEQPTEPQMLSALAVVDDATPLWRALHRILDLIESDQKAAVCLANLNNEQRHYNAGRLAMCEDLRDALLQKWSEARSQNEEMQR
jgi:hypothetical protein